MSLVLLLHSTYSLYPATHNIIFGNGHKRTHTHIYIHIYIHTYINTHTFPHTQTQGLPPAWTQSGFR